MSLDTRPATPLRSRPRALVAHHKPDPAWRDRAACRELDPAMFYATDESDVARARAVCAICPVKDSCLRTGLSEIDRPGIWGGLTEHERARLAFMTRSAPATVVAD